MQFNFAALKRSPDFEAENLFAHDASDRLIIDKAAELQIPVAAGETVVIGDRYGALTLGANFMLGAKNVRVYQDYLNGELALKRNAKRFEGNASFENFELDAKLLSGARLVLMQMPRSLTELREVADAIARFAAADVHVISAGRVKHMSRNMNNLLQEYFETVNPDLAKQKSRVITFSGKKEISSEPPFPVWGSDKELSFALASFGATFGGSTLDHGTRLLLKHFLPVLKKTELPQPEVVDVGSGNGTIAVSAALANSSASIIATDVAQSAVRATVLTAEKAQVDDRVQVLRADGCSGLEAESVDFALINPPFHSGSAVNDRLAENIFQSTAKALRQGAEAWIVFNSHLGYSAAIRKHFGSFKTVARDKKFTVVRAVKEPK